MTYKIEIYVIRSGWTVHNKCTRILTAEKDKLEFITSTGSKVLSVGFPYVISEDHE